MESVFQNPPKFFNLPNFNETKEKTFEKLALEPTDEDVEKFIVGLENPLFIWGAMRPNLRNVIYEKYNISEKFREGLEEIMQNVVTVLKKLDLVSEDDVKLSGL